MRRMPNRAPLTDWLVPAGDRLRLASRDPDSTPHAPGDRDTTNAAAVALHNELGVLQERLWAENERSLLVVLQAMDAGGKDGTIKKVFTGVNPQGVKVTSFKAPSDEERAYDFLWRIHRCAPRHGEIGIFNRSHYEDVLVVRVHGWITPQVCKARYESIKAFERTLSREGTRVVKLMLHISKDEQAARMRKRLEKPNKAWKFNTADLEERKYWDDYTKAYQDALSATSTDDAPWYVVPANKKWYRDWAVLTILTETLREMDPKFPPPQIDLSKVIVE
jgi:PPK2 family polyphosphate:nucleotide phosphotransferase